MRVWKIEEPESDSGDELDKLFDDSDKEEDERDVDGRDWTAMHFKKRTDKANPNTAKTKQN